MKHFRKLGTGLPVEAIRGVLVNHYDLWDNITLRQDFEGTPHKFTETIYIRGPEKLEREFYQGQTEARPYPLPTELVGPLEDLFAEVKKLIDPVEVGYMMLVSLYPRSGISAHIDEGVYAEHYQRFHIPISSVPNQNLFTCADETVKMKEGELWCFNHQKLHKVTNMSGKERIHLIFDAVLRKPIAF
jgi:hypothetical protein